MLIFANINSKITSVSSSNLITKTYLQTYNFPQKTSNGANSEVTKTPNMVS